MVHPLYNPESGYSPKGNPNVPLPPIGPQGGSGVVSSEGLRHFKDVPSQTIQPVRQAVAQKYTPEELQKSLDAFWNNMGQKYHPSYQAGKIIGSSTSATNLTTVLTQIATIIENSIKSSNSKNNITSENLRDHFYMLSSVMKVIISDLNALYARESRANNSLIEFDAMDILAILSGYISTKVYGA